MPSTTASSLELLRKAGRDCRRHRRNREWVRAVLRSGRNDVTEEMRCLLCDADDVPGGCWSLVTPRANGGSASRPVVRIGRAASPRAGHGSAVTRRERCAQREASHAADQPPADARDRLAGATQPTGRTAPRRTCLRRGDPRRRRRACHAELDEPGGQRPRRGAVGSEDPGSPARPTGQATASRTAPAARKIRAVT